MRFRSLVISWCVCAIHSGMQIASGYRSLDIATSRSTYHPPGNVKTRLVHSPRNIPSLQPSPVPLPVSRPRSPSRYAVDAIAKLAEIDEKTGHRRSKLTTADRDKIVESSGKRESRHRRRKKCSCRKRDSRRRMESPLLAKGEARKKLNGSSMLKNLFTSVGTTDTPTSTLNPELTTWQSFADIAFTTTDAIPSTANAMSTDAAREADDPTDETYRRDSPRKRCKIKCTMKDCKRKKMRGMNVIEVLAQEFFQNDLGNVRVSRTRSSSPENVMEDPQTIMK